MNPHDDPQVRYILETIMPWMVEGQKHLASDSIELVHYTTAPAAHSILDKGQVWLRSASCMNDVSEIKYGLDTFFAALETDEGLEWCRKVDELSPELSRHIVELFMGNVEDFTYMTFMGCFSVHSDGEQAYGRLSMWRAYTEGNGVALVLDAPNLIRQLENKPWWLVQVDYRGVAGIVCRLSDMLKTIRDTTFFQGLSEGHVRSAIFTACLSIVVSCKHPAFVEEQEWRIVYSETGLTSGDDGPVSETPQREIINGIPQMVYALPLSFREDVRLLNGIMIGPTQYEGPIREALIHHLHLLGQKERMPKISSCGVPLRLRS